MCRTHRRDEKYILNFRPKPRRVKIACKEQFIDQFYSMYEGIRRSGGTVLVILNLD
jgi:hypothetical protein